MVVVAEGSYERYSESIDAVKSLSKALLELSLVCAREEVCEKVAGHNNEVGLFLFGNLLEVACLENVLEDNVLCVVDHHDLKFSV